MRGALDGGARRASAAMVGGAVCRSVGGQSGHQVAIKAKGPRLLEGLS